MQKSSTTPRLGYDRPRFVIFCCLSPRALKQNPSPGQKKVGSGLVAPTVGFRSDGRAEHWNSRLDIPLFFDLLFF
jgi:hypothetical protein